MSGRPEVTYHDMPVGRTFTPHQFDLRQDEIDAYQAIFTEGRDVVPTGLLAVHARNAYNTDGPTPSGGVMASMTFRLRQKLIAATGYEFRATVIEQFERKGKGWVRFENVLDRDEAYVATVEIVGVWPL